MKMKSKEKKGITLIALAVTIVVLLILVGISLNLVIGNQGIVTKSQIAKEENRGATVEDEVKLWRTDKYTDTYSSNKTAQTMDALLADLQSRNLLTTDEVATVKSTQKVTIGSHEIDFGPIELVAGLYQTGTKTLLKSWEQLKTDGDITVETSELPQGPTKPEIITPESTVTTKKLTGVLSTLTGDLRISDEISEIGELYGSSCGFAYSSSAVLNLTGLYIPGTIKTIPSSEFCQMENLKTVTLEEGVESISSYTFTGCTALETINIPSTVTSIAYEAFYLCTSIKNIFIPSNVSIIEGAIFNGWKNTQVINIQATSKPSGWGDAWNDGCSAAVNWGVNP